MALTTRGSCLPTLQPHLRNEEVVISRQIEWRVQHHVDPDFMPLDRPITLRGLLRRGVDAIDHRVGGSGIMAEDGDGEPQRAVRAVAGVKRHVRR